MSQLPPNVQTAGHIERIAVISIQAPVATIRDWIKRLNDPPDTSLRELRAVLQDAIGKADVEEEGSSNGRN